MNNWERLKSKFVEIHPWMQNVSYEDMQSLIGLPEVNVNTIMNSWKESFYGNYEI